MYFKTKFCLFLNNPKDLTMLRIYILIQQKSDTMRGILYFNIAEVY